MSDDSTKDPIHAQIERDALREKHRKEVLEKELIIRGRKADALVEKINQNDRDISAAKAINYGSLSEEEIEAKQKENTDYMGAAKHKMPFITEDFDQAVPFFRKNLILIGAPTGSGKSTTVANIIHRLIHARNAKTGKRYRVLVLTNEEKSEDVYNRVTCLIKGWSYTNHDKFSEAQVEEFNKYLVGLSKSGTLTVVDDQFGGAMGTTTTVEGICQVFDNLIEKQDYYDVVLLDYYQNVTESKKNLTMGEYECQALLARRLDRYKNIYPAPIVVLAQVREIDQARTPFKIRIEGRKTILNVSTCALEIVAKPADRCTDWITHKSRFNEAMGKIVQTGYDSGKYVPYNAEFKERVAKWKAANAAQEFDKSVGMPDVTEEEEDGIQKKASGD